MNDKARSGAPAQAPSREKVVFERTYRARVEELWALWTTKEGFESWWGPEGFHVKVHALDARAGGPLHYDMIASGPEQIAFMKQAGMPTSHPARGIFKEVKRHQRIAMSHIMDFIPGVAPYESSAVVEFFPSGDSVRMVITLDPLHDEQWTKQATMGWTSQLTKLDKRFAAAAR